MLRVWEAVRGAAGGGSGMWFGAQLEPVLAQRVCRLSQQTGCQEPTPLVCLTLFGLHETRGDSFPLMQWS